MPEYISGDISSLAAMGKCNSGAVWIYGIMDRIWRSDELGAFAWLFLSFLLHFIRIGVAFRVEKLSIFHTPMEIFKFTSWESYETALV